MIKKIYNSNLMILIIQKILINNNNKMSLNYRNNFPKIHISFNKIKVKKINKSNKNIQYKIIDKIH